MPHSIDDPTPEQPTPEEESEQPTPEEESEQPILTFPIVAGTAAARCHLAAEKMFRSGNAFAAGLYEISATLYICTTALFNKLELLTDAVGGKKEDTPDESAD